MSNEPTELKKDIRWKISGSVYVVRNVPYLKAEYDGEELMEMDVSITLTALRDLMVEEAIPHDINYDDFADIKLFTVEGAPKQVSPPTKMNSTSRK